MGQSRQAGFWTVSSVGRAPGLHPVGRRFESCTVHGAWYVSALLLCTTVCGACYGVGAFCRLAREPVGALLCSHSSQSSSGTGWVYSARGGIGRHARFRLWCPLRRVGSTPTGRTSGRGFRSFLLPLAFHSCYDGWDAVRRIGSIGRATAL